MNSHNILAAVVNHDTSRYIELMLRSLIAHHSKNLNISIAILDNESKDEGLLDLRAFAERNAIPFILSGFTTETKNNSHGEILRRFVRNHPVCTHYLFLDADVVFLEDNTIDTMMMELDNHSDAFGIMPTLSPNGWDRILNNGEDANLYSARLHPCCALIKNTDIFRHVVDEVGFSCVNYLWAEREEYIDTFTLMTKVMRTHGFKHLISDKLILHFFSVSYVWESDHVMRWKKQRRDEILDELRKMQT